MYTIALKSRDRFAGDINDYSVKLPSIYKGNYKATFTVLTKIAANAVGELQIRWDSINHLSTGITGFPTVCLFDSTQSEGTLYLSDPGTLVTVRILDIATNQVAANLSEHVIMVHLEKI